jgi:hypothetical protein
MEEEHIHFSYMRAEPLIHETNTQPVKTYPMVLLDTKTERREIRKICHGAEVDKNRKVSTMSFMQT